MKHAVLAAGAAVLLLVAPHARAGQAGDALSKCLAASATPADRTVLVRWVFGALSVHPDLKGLIALDESTRAMLDREAAAVYQRLIAGDCAAQSRQAILREGASGYGEAFGALGELAVGQFVEHEDVQAGLARVAAHLDQAQILKAPLSP